MLKLGTVQFRGKCYQHATPESGCRKCDLLAQIEAAHRRLTALMNQFGPRHPTTTRVRQLDSQRQIAMFSEEEAPRAPAEF